MSEEKTTLKTTEKEVSKKNVTDSATQKNSSVVYEQNITLEIFSVEHIFPQPGAKKLEVFNEGPGEVIATTDMFVTKTSLKTGEKQLFEDLSVLSLMSGSKPRVKVVHLR